MADVKGLPVRRLIAALDQAVFSAGSLLLTVGVSRTTSPRELGVFGLIWAGYWLALGSQRAFVSEPALLNSARKAASGAISAGAGLVVVFAGAAGSVIGTVLLVCNQPTAATVSFAAPLLLCADAIRYVFISIGTAGRALVVDGLSLLILAFGLMVPDTIYGLDRWLLLWAASSAAAVLVGAALRGIRFRGALNAARSFWPTNRNMLIEFGLTSGGGQLALFLMPLVAGLVTVAGFRVAQASCSPLNVVLSGATLALLPAFATSFDNEGVGGVVRRATRLAAALFTVCIAWAAILAILPSHYLVSVFGDNWRLSQGAGAIIALQVAAVAVANCLAICLRVAGLSHRSVWARTLSAPLLVVGTLGGAVYGVTWAAIGLLSASVISLYIWHREVKAMGAVARIVPGRGAEVLRRVRANGWRTYALPAVAAGLEVLLLLSINISYVLPALGGIALLLLLLLITRPLMLACVLGFLAAALPKAGIRVGTLPVPFLLLGLTLGVLLIWWLTRRSRRTGPIIRGAGLVAGGFVTWIVCRVAYVYANQGEPTILVSLSAWGTLPIFYMLLARTTALGVVPKTLASWARALEAGFIAACFYGVVQFFLGIAATSISGITIALGDSALAKNNGITVNGVAQAASKVPSTYQSGNLFGLIAAFFLVVCLQRYRQAEYSFGVFDLVLSLSAAVSVVLSGSRTAYLAVAVCLIVVLLFRASVAQRISLLCVGSAAWVLAQGLIPGFSDRFSLAAIFSSGGAGRLEQWTSVLSRLGSDEFLVGSLQPLYGSDANFQAEGWLGIIQQIGLVGVVLMFLAVWSITSGDLAEWRLPLLALLVGMVIDSSYFTFPTLFLPAARMLAPVCYATPQPFQSPTKRGTARGVAPVTEPAVV